MKEGWEVKKLGEVCETGSGGTPLKMHDEYYNNGTIPWLRSGEVCTKEIYATELYITDKGLKNSSAKIFPANTVLVAMYGATAGQVGILKIASTTNQAVCGILPNETMSPEYIYYYFLFNKEALVAQAVGGAQPNISQIKIKNIQIPVPPIAEQQRIVSILDTAFLKIEKLKSNAELNLNNAKALFQSALQYELSPKKGWEVKKLGDKNVLNIIDGDRGSNYPKKDEFTNDGYCLFLSTKNVRQNGFCFNSLSFISNEKDKEMGKGKLRRRDLVMTTRGTIGNIGLYDDSVFLNHIRINSGMLIFRPNEDLILSEFYFWVLSSPQIKNQISKYTTGAAQPQLPIKTLVNFIFNFPSSLSEQQSIVEKLDSLSSRCQAMEANYKQTLKACDELKQSLLTKAFNGEL